MGVGGFSKRIKEGSWPGGDLRLPAGSGEMGSTSVGPRHLEMPTTLPAKPQTPHSSSFTASVSPPKTAIRDCGGWARRHTHAHDTRAYTQAHTR